MNAMLPAILSVLAGFALVWISIAKRDYLNEKGGGMALPMLIGVGLVVNGLIIFVKN